MCLCVCVAISTLNIKVLLWEAIQYIFAEVKGQTNRQLHHHFQVNIF